MCCQHLVRICEVIAHMHGVVSDSAGQLVECPLHRKQSGKGLYNLSILGILANQEPEHQSAQDASHHNETVGGWVPPKASHPF